ncbi:MAG: hypothetical protein ACI9G1_003170 [Pirellulaceae bacterium]|jgi:hypothetical protein
MARFLIGWELGSNLGHVTVQRPIVTRLLEQGHDVVMAVSNRAQVSNFMQQQGLPIIRCPRGRSSKREGSCCTFPQAILHSGYKTVESIKQLVDEWFSIFALASPDVCIFDYSPSGLVAAHVAGIPSSTLGNGFCSPPPSCDFPIWRRSRNRDPGGDEQMLLSHINTIQREFKLDDYNHLSDIFDVDVAVLTTIPELDHFANRSTGSFTYVGCLAASSGIQPEWPSGDGPRTFAYLKDPGEDHRETFGATLRHLADSKLPTIAFISSSTARVQAEYSTETFKIYRAPIDLGYVCDNCDLAIINGGHGTTVRLAIAGKPMLILPTQMEQEVTANRVSALGCGLQTTWRNPDMVKQHIAKLKNEFPQYRRSAQELADQYSNCTPEKQANAASEVFVQLADHAIGNELLITV